MTAQLVKNLPAMQETPFDSWVRKIPWRRDRLPTPVFLGSPCGSAGKESSCNCRRRVRFLGWEDPLKKGGYPLQYSGLENSMDCIVHGVTKSRTRLSDFHYAEGGIGHSLSPAPSPPLSDIRKPVSPGKLCPGFLRRAF